MKTIKVYTAAELKKKFPDAFDRALEHFQQDNDSIPWSEEIIDSLKAIFDRSGLRLRNYSIGAYCYSDLTVDMESDVANLSGNRALAWIENNLLADLRIPYKPMFKLWSDGWKPTVKRGELSKYGAYYRPGMIHPRPFTGVCFDEDFIEALLKAIKSGDTLKEAYTGLADVAQKLMESEVDYQNSEENFLEQDYQFTKDGTRI